MDTKFIKQEINCVNGTFQESLTNVDSRVLTILAITFKNSNSGVASLESK